MTNLVANDPGAFGTIPAAEAMILWTDRQGIGVIDVVVCRQNDPEVNDQHRFESSRGVCESDWLNGDPMSSPIGVFLWMATVEGFQSDEVKILALAEIARIEGQGWAIEMLKALGAAPDEG